MKRRQAPTTPAQDRLLALLRKRGKLTRVQALRAVSAGTVSRALTAGKLVKVCSGRRVSCIEARTADVRTHHVVMDVRREAVVGVPGGRLAAMSLRHRPDAPRAGRRLLHRAVGDGEDVRWAGGRQPAVRERSRRGELMNDWNEQDEPRIPVPDRAGRRTSAWAIAVLAAAAFQAAFAVGAAAQSGAAADRAALEALYDATDGPNWTDSTNWKTGAPLDEWFGVYTDDAGRVRGLHLKNNDLSGPIPPALGNLANLQALNLENNDLSGPIPPALGNLANLKWLYLGVNELSGPIPSALGSLANLEWLGLYYNELSAIPPALGNLANLEWLGLYYNELSAIPPALGNLANLKSLYLFGNQLSGPIPPELGNLANLKTLSLEENQLSGPIPPELGNLANLERLYLSSNWGVVGALPSGLRRSPLTQLANHLTQACAPDAWEDWLKTIEFTGRLCGTPPLVDVLVVYTPAVRESAGGAAEIAAEIDLMIAETNRFYETSGIRLRLALAGRSEVQYVETNSSSYYGNSSIDLDRLQHPSDGHMDEVHSLRDSVGADLVHLIRDKGGIPGIAFLGGAFSLSQTFVSDASGIARPSSKIFAHELGHNMRLHHERQAVSEWLTRRHHPAFGYMVREEPPSRGTLMGLSSNRCG